MNTYLKQLSTDDYQCLKSLFPNVNIQNIDYDDSINSWIEDDYELTLEDFCYETFKYLFNNLEGDFDFYFDIIKKTIAINIVDFCGSLQSIKEVLNAIESNEWKLI